MDVMHSINQVQRTIHCADGAEAHNAFCASLPGT
jgi:hypothetical protein